MDLIGMWSTYTYDPKNRLVGDNTSGSYSSHQYTYSYDLTDNLLVQPEGPQVLTFSYDAASRITTALAGINQIDSYSYDLNGNLGSIMDSIGNLTTMTYDDENRMRSQTRPDGQTATYIYDGNGMKRLEKLYGGLSTLVWDGMDYLQQQISVSSLFVSQSVPTAMTAGQQYTVTVTWENNGAMAWLGDRQYGIWSQYPTQNSTWGVQEVYLGAGEIVAVGSSKSFVFQVTAPSSPGTYTFAWATLSPDTGAFPEVSAVLHIPVS